MSTTVVPRTDTLSPAPQIAAAQGGSTAVCPPGEALVAATEIVREVAQAELDSVAKDELLSLLHGLDEAARLVEACRAKVLSAVDQREAWRGNGRDASMAAWRSRTTRTGQGKAHREVSTARTLTATPGATDALTAGHMTPEHAEALSRIATSGGVERRAKIAQALADPESSRELLDSAKHLDAPRFARAAQA